MPYGVDGGLVTWSEMQTPGTYFYLLGYGGMSPVAGVLP